ncbi:MAG: glycosyltransferase, partial [Methanobacterium paludis]|nr:glycosyltransferase [Methanobacterium paludis]
IINKYASNNSVIEPVLAKKNKGITYNMNRALKRVDSDFVSYLDGDDLMSQQKIEKQVNYLNENPNLVACLHDMDVFDLVKGKSLGKFSEVLNFDKIGSKINVNQIFNPSLFLCPSSAMYRTEKIPINGFDNRLKYWSEFLFMVEVLMKGDIGFINEVLGSYRLHGDNATSSQDLKKIDFENSLMVYSIIISKYPELYSLVKKRRNSTYIGKVIECIKEENVEGAKNYSKILMSEGSFIKGLGVYLLSNVLNKERVNTLYENKRLLKLSKDLMKQFKI